jgi:polysaccharide chain length determinant protein (PEP-CTERM system associated)
MDDPFYKQMIKAVLRELNRYKSLAMALFIVASFVVLLAGYLYPKQYVTRSLIYADVTNIIEPLLRGRAVSTELYRPAKAREVLYTSRIMDQVVKEAGLVDENSPRSEIDRMVNHVRQNTTIEVENENYFRVTYTDLDPDLSFNIHNALVNVFITDAADSKRQESRGAYQFIDEQVKAYQRKLQEADNRLKEFNAANRDGTAQSVNNRIESLTQQIESLQLEIDEQDARTASLQSQLTSEGQFLAKRSQVDALSERLAQMVSQLDTLRLSYQETYPDIVSLKGQIAELEADIRKTEGQDVTNSNPGGGDGTANPYYQELKSQLVQARVDQGTLRKRKKVLERILSEQYERSSRIVERGAELTELTRDYNVTKEVYEQMLERKEAARLSMTLDIEGQGVNYKIQEAAAFPRKPSGIQFWHLAIAGPLIGLLLPLGLLVAYVMVDPRVRFTKVLQDLLPKDVALLGVVPHYNTPVAKRIVKSDMLAYGGLALVAMAVYIGLVVMIVTQTV